MTSHAHQHVLTHERRTDLSLRATRAARNHCSNAWRAWCAVDRAVAMKERPVVMTAESVRALLAGRKTQTRRLIEMRH
jgi:hypothetical protein